MARKANVRSIRFGIRFKFSIIMIIGISFASALIGLAVYNQHENKIKDTILQLSGTILKGAADSAESFLRNMHLLQSEKASDLSPRAKKQVLENIKKSKDDMADYFSGIVKKEEILDIAFLIDVDWNDTSIDWQRRDQARYYYFHRKTGKMFNVNLYNRKGQVIKGGRGRDDAQLKPTIFSYFMQNVNTSSYLAFSEGRSEDGKNFVIVGMPLFRYKKDANLYRSYLDFKKTSFTSGASVKKYRKNRRRYRNSFLKRIIDNGLNIEYDLVLNTKKKKWRVYSYLLGKIDTGKLGRVTRDDFKRSFLHMINEGIEDSRLPLFRIKVILNSMLKEYRLSLKKNVEKKDLWKKFYRYIRYRGISVETAQDLDQLALISFRKDLSGVLGIFLLRDAFYSEMLENRREILNLIVSILIRVIVVALFLPTFIIRAISSLEEGAMEIGKGNLEKKIDVKGSDELGRLADIINIMTGNLKQAQREMLDKQRMHEELKTAHGIQSALLPEKFPAFSGVSFGAYYMAQTESGGDYYDFIKLDNNRVGVAIADVSGHGVASGLVMAMTRTLLHLFCLKNDDPKKILEMINEYLYENTASNYFVTMFYGIVDLKSLSMKFASAGHNPGIIMRKGKIVDIPAGGIALGATSNAKMSRLNSTKTVKFEKGDYLVQYTDGVDESMNAKNKEFGLDRFHRALLNSYGKSPNDICKAVVKSIDDFTGKVPQHDDITLIVMKLG